MNAWTKVALVGCVLCVLAQAGAGWAEAQPAPETTPPAQAPQPAAGQANRPLGVLALCFGAGLIVLSGSLGIAYISTRATDAIARQPEAAGSMFLAWLFPAAMIEGAMLAGILICYMAIDLLR